MRVASVEEDEEVRKGNGGLLRERCRARMITRGFDKQYLWES